MGQRWNRWKRRLLALACIWLAGLLAAIVLRWWRDYPEGRHRPFLTRGPGFLVFAHRGASGRESEHTLRSYRRALEEAADVLELDVRITLDDRIVVFHDATTSRLYGESGKVEELSFNELSQRARRAGLPPPLTLPQLFDAFPGVRFNVELKGESPRLAQLTWRAIESAGREDEVLVASMHDASIWYFRSLCDWRVATAASPSEGLVFYLFFLLDVPARPDYDALQVPTSALGLHFDREDYVEFAHRHGLAVHFFTVDDPAAIARAKAIGADGIMTNFPDRAARAL
jgi:glycerophosphoryl diester phosphodiesterase